MEQFQEKPQANPEGDRYIGNVKRGPVVGAIIEVEKINNASVEDPIVDITDSAGKDRREGKPFRKGHFGDDEHDDEDGDDEERKIGKDDPGKLVSREKTEDPSVVLHVYDRKKGGDMNRSSRV